MKPTLYVLVGIPGAGKTTYAASAYKDATHISSDVIRKELYGDESIQGDSNQVFELMKSRSVNAIKEGKDVVYDATNIQRKYRVALLQNFKSIECAKTCVCVIAPIHICIERNKKRGRKVPEAVLFRMLRQFNVPHTSEGFDVVEVKYTANIDHGGVCRLIYHGNDDYNTPLIDVLQDNPHHDFSIGKHCIQTLNTLNNDALRNKDLCIAAWCHDIGKAFTQTYDEGGIAHYFNHENVSSYMTLAFGYGLNSAWLVEAHMKPFTWHNDIPEKFIKFYGKDFVDSLMLLHKADILAQKEYC